jgi:hypothetical protein
MSQAVVQGSRRQVLTQTRAQVTLFGISSHLKSTSQVYFRIQAINIYSFTNLYSYDIFRASSMFLRCFGHIRDVFDRLGCVDTFIGGQGMFSSHLGHVQDAFEGLRCVDTFISGQGMFSSGFGCDWDIFEGLGGVWTPLLFPIYIGISFS